MKNLKVMEKKQQLVKEAMSKYQKGTHYKNMVTGKVVLSSGEFEYYDELTSPHIFDKVNRDIVWFEDTGNWAEVTNPNK